MRTKEQTKRIAFLAETTPEIVEAVLNAYYRVRYTPVEPIDVEEDSFVKGTHIP